METENEELKKEQIPSVSDDPEFKYRVYSVFSYFVVLIIIGLPVWWYTTRVYRANLPLTRMYDEFPNKTDHQFSLPLSLEYDVLITIVNPDPQGLKVDIDSNVLDSSLQPFLKKVSRIADFIVKSQWLYMVELGASPVKLPDHYALYQKQLPRLITPLEKKLWSHLSPRPCLNLVIYISHCNVPLYVYNGRDERSTTNAFLSPRWGGISILNPDQESCAQGKFAPDLRNLTSIFVTQLSKMLKLDGTTDEDLRALMRRKAEDMVGSTRRTLKSLAQLLSEISSIVISDQVANKIHTAVNGADVAQSFLEQDDVEYGLNMAKFAFDNAERAFKDPSLLALLYFPEDQKYAVYIPLFLPVMIPVLMSLITLRKYMYGSEKTKHKVE